MERLVHVTDKNGQRTKRLEAHQLRLRCKSGIGGAHRASPQYVSGDYFRALDVGAALGRVLIPADDEPGAPAVVVLTYGYWQRQFGAGRSIVKKTLDLNGVPFTVGVADAGFAYLTPGNVHDFSVALWQRRNLQVGWKWTPSQEDAGSWCSEWRSEWHWLSVSRGRSHDFFSA